MFDNTKDLLFPIDTSTYQAGIEARSILKDSNLRMLGKTQVFVGAKSSTEVSLVFSMCNTLQESLELYHDIRLRKSPLLIAKLRRFYIPRRVTLPLGIKTVRLDNAINIREAIKNRQRYSLQSVISTESLIQADSVFYDLSTITRVIKANTIDKRMKLMAKVRHTILELYKQRIESFMPDEEGKGGYKFRILYFRGPFLTDTGIRTSIILTQLMRNFSPLLLFLEWMATDMLGFKAWMKKFGVVLLFDNAKGKSMSLVFNDTFLKSKNFNLRYILARLHVMDGRDIQEVENMMNEDLNEEINNVSDVADSDNIEEKEKDDKKAEKTVIKDINNTEEDIADLNEETNNDKLELETFEEAEDVKDDLQDDNLTEETLRNINEVDEDLEDEIVEINQKQEDNKIVKNDKKQEELYQKIVDDKHSTEMEKALALQEVHNYSNLKKAVETPEVKTLRKKLVASSKTPKEIANDIKKHTLEVEDDNIDPNSDYSKNMINTYTKSYKKNFKEDDFQNIIKNPMKYTYPALLTDVSSKDISDREFMGTLKTFKYQTHNGQEIEFKLQIPETTEDGRIFIGGSYKRITFQNAAKPVIKSGENVIVTTSGGKKIICSIQGSFASMEEKSVVMALKKISDLTKDIKVKTTKDLGDFIYKNRVSYSLIYLNRYFTSIRNQNIDIDFRGYSKISNDKTYIGHIGSTQLFHNPEKDTIYMVFNGKKREESSMKFILQLLEQLYPDIAPKAISQAKNITHTRINGAYAKIMGKEIPIILILMIACPLFKKGGEEGLLDILKENLGLEYKVVNKSAIDKIPETNRVYGVIELQDYAILIKYNSVTAELLLSPLLEMDLTSYNKIDINVIMQDYIKNSNTTLYIENFVEDFLDPITQRICAVYGIPDDFIGLMLYAVSLFTDYKTYTSSDIRNYRVIGPDEVINRCIYQVISDAFAASNAKVKRGSRPDIKISQDAVVQTINKLTSKVESNDLSPIRAIMQRTEVSFKGHGGINDERSYNQERRLFAEHNVGTETRSTAYSANAGIKKFLPFNPVIADATGNYNSATPEEAAKDFNPSNMYSFVESLVPYIDSDHINRVLMVSGQFGHILPIEGGDTYPVSTHADESALYMTPQFSYFAKMDGVIKEVNQDYIIIEYKNKEVEGVKLEDINRNSDKGYYLKNDFILAKAFKVGEKVSKGDLIAFNKNFYKKKNNGKVALTFATLQHIALMDHQLCWEDSCVIYEKMSKALATPLAKRVARTIDLNSSITNPITDMQSEVDASTVLLKYSQLSDDETINNIFMGADSLINEEMHAKYKGKIVDIRIYYRMKKDTIMSDSVKKFLRDVTQKQRLQKNTRSLDGVTSKFSKATLSGEPQLLTAGKFSKINGDIVEDGKMLVEYFIEVKDRAGSADKIVVDRSLKAEISSVFPDEMRPIGVLSGRRPSMIFSNYSELNRMTSGLNKHAMLLACLADIAIRARIMLNKKPEPDTLLDYKSNMDMVEGKIGYK